MTESVDETALATVQMHRPRWGDPDAGIEMPSAASQFVTEGASPRAAVLPAAALTEAARAALVAVVGPDGIDVEDDGRVDHTRGYSTPDLLRLLAGDASDAPDAVVYPADADAVVGVLRTCARHRLAVVPFTGGTSVVGGLTPDRAGFVGVVSVDLRRMDALVEIDEISRIATFQAGIRGTRAEELLRTAGYTLGHFPQSYAGAGLGGYAATRSAGQSSAGYGRFDDMVEGLTLATGDGLLTLGTAPKSAAGPDLRQVVLGSEGAFGIITEVRVRIHRQPQVRVFEGWRFPDFDAGADALRRLAQDGPMPTVLRLSDEVETALNLADPARLGADPGGCLVVAGFEGAAADVRWRQSAAATVFSDAGAQSLGAEPGEAWRTGRFRGPYLRDPMLASGVLVETLETACFWSRLHQVKQAVTAALTETLTAAGAPPAVLCHISHVYHSGASLYFTVVAPLGDDPLITWAQAKSAATDAIRATGATITHHHGVGRDHRTAFHGEIGPLGVEILTAIKTALDPDGICNPGILL